MMRSFVSADILQAIDQLIYILGNWLVMMVISTNQVAKSYISQALGEYQACKQ